MSILSSENTQRFNHFYLSTILWLTPPLCVMISPSVKPISVVCLFYLSKCDSAAGRRTPWNTPASPLRQNDRCCRMSLSRMCSRHGLHGLSALRPVPQQDGTAKCHREPPPPPGVPHEEISLPYSEPGGIWDLTKERPPPFPNLPLYATIGQIKQKAPPGRDIERQNHDSRHCSP